MIEIDIDEAQAHLKEYLAKLTQGETVVLRDGPVTRYELKQIAPAIQPLKQPRRIGAGVGEMVIHPSFYDPLPEDIMKYFEGRGDEPEGELTK